MASNYHSLPTLKVDGTEVEPNISENVLQIVVEESIHYPSMFTIVLRNDYESGKTDDAPWEKFQMFEIGKPISIGFSSSTNQSEEENKEDSLIQGEITAIDAHFTEDTQAPIFIRGYDYSHRLHRGRHNRSFQNVTDSDVVKKIAQEIELGIGTVEDSGEPHDYLFQENQTNMEFLRSRAARIGFELFVRDGQLNFRQPKVEGESLKLVWLKDVNSFHVRVTSAEQVNEVEVRGWDYTTKRTIIASAQSEKLKTETELQSKKQGSQISGNFEGLKESPKMIVVDKPVFKPKEAEAIAQTVCNELGGQFVTADAVAEGNPQIRPGVQVELEKLGPYTGKYYVTGVRHIYTERVYTTEFSVRGLRSGDLLDTLASGKRLRPGQTSLVGLVTDNEDPEGLGRVKVKFPTLTEEHNSNWARVVNIGGGKNRGFDCLPEIDDEVLVVFEHGDIHRPYVMGGVWNGTDSPPNSVDSNVRGGQVRLRTFQTRTGHKIQFVEEDQGGSKAGVQITTKGGHQIYLDDSGNNIVIKSSGNINLESSGNISMSSSGTVNMSSSGSFGLNSSGSVSLTGSNVSIN